MKLTMVITQTNPELVFNLRNSQGSELCPLSTMEDLHALIREKEENQ